MTGSAQGANTSLRYNRGQLGKRPNMFKKEWSYKNAKKNYVKASGGNEQYKKLNNFQKKLIRNQIRKEQSADRKQMITIMTIIVAIFIVSLLKLEYGPSDTIIQERKVIKLKKQRIEEGEKQYLEYLVSGDNWIEDDKWDAAITLYKKALIIYPDSYDAKYRLVLAYGYKCERMKFDCDLGKTLVHKLLLDNPIHKKELVKLDSIFSVNLSEPVILGE